MDDNFASNVENMQDENVRKDWSDASADLLHAGNQNNGGAEAMVMGPWTDADACQAEAPTGGHTAESVQSRQGPATEQPSQAGLAMAHPAGVDVCMYVCLFNYSQIG